MIADFDEFFQTATGNSPYPYQRRLAGRCPEFLHVETGLGKTEGLVLGWLWRRYRGIAAPRRLIYTLPMRTLVEQTVDRIRQCICRLESAGIEWLPQVEAVLGGDVGDTWFQQPEECWIVVGTQDMLLSRALNRGYGMSRFQWPMTFGAVNNDAYWVIDEVQLQGIGAVTARQLQAFRDRYGTLGFTETTLASATIDEAWFETGDFDPESAIVERLAKDDRENAGVRCILEAQKTLERLDETGASEIAKAIVARHKKGSLTLAVFNTVARAQEIARCARLAGNDVDVLLLHSRFRPHDREAKTQALQSEMPPAGRIVIATQVVEAGVDISAATLFTETAPWSSIVQRLGRCNRRGTDDSASVIWIDGGAPTRKNSLPYDIDELTQARDLLTSLVGSSVGAANLPAAPINRGKGLVLRSPELFDLFDTSFDLAGHDVDVRPYIRDTSDYSAFVFWRPEPPGVATPPHGGELCPVGLADLRSVVEDARRTGRGANIRVANQFASTESEWEPLLPGTVRPGLVVWLHGSIGCYDATSGFDRALKDDVAPVMSTPQEATFGCDGCAIGADQTSVAVAQALREHSEWTEQEAARLTESLQLAEPQAGIVREAALWHDVGKAHPVFQATMRASIPDASDGEFFAKAPRANARHSRKGFRHELPGALAYLASHDGEPNANLIAFLIAAHHGKFRVCAQQLPYETEAHPIRILGNCDGDEIPEVTISSTVTSPKAALKLEPFRVGTVDGTPTWVERTNTILQDPSLGPFRLALLELLVRIADWRASRRLSGPPS